MSAKPTEGPQTNAAARINALVRILPLNGSVSVKTWLPGAHNVLFGPAPISNKGNALAYRVLAEAHRMIDQYEEEVRESSMPAPQKELCLSYVGPLRNVLSPENLGANMQVLSEGVRSGLRACEVFMLSRPDLSDEELSQIQKSIAELEGILAQAAISPVLQGHLLELVRLAKDSISRYRIYGAKALQKQFKKMLGESMILCSELGTQEPGPHDKEAVKKVGAFLSVFEAIVVRVGQYQPTIQLITDSSPLLKALLTSVTK